jgi:hypothetical protein
VSGRAENPKDLRSRDYTAFGFREVGGEDPLDLYLDRELPRESAAFRAAFVKPEFRSRLHEIEDTLGELHRPIRTPDMSDAILDAVDARRPFVVARSRWRVSVGRLTVAAAVLALVGGLVMVERFHPGMTNLTADPTPLTNIVNAASVTHQPTANAQDPSATRPGVPLDDLRGPARAAGTNTASTILQLAASRLGPVEAVEVRTGSFVLASGLPRHPSGGRAGEGFGSMPVPELSPEWSASAFATFPTVDKVGGANGWVWSSRRR